MAIVVLVLWLFTAGAGFSLLVSSNLGRARPAPAPTPLTLAPAAAAASDPSKREERRAARDRFDTASLTAAKNAPMVPGLRPLLEFAHPAFAIIGLGFWLCFTLVHNRVLGWIAFGMIAATAGLGLTWFTTNARAAKARRRDEGDPPPSFGIRLVILHGGAATVTFALAALTALVLRR